MHASYACRNSGACCTAGWPIAVEPEIERGLRDALAARRLRPHGHATGLGVGDGAPTLLAMDAHGRCAFHDGGAQRCEIHRALGHASLPLACRQFPRVALLTPAGVSVALSHYCPTVAALLFDTDTGAALEVVEHAAGFPADGEYVGLDARDGFGPLLRPGVLLGWDVHEVWERALLDALARGGRTAEEALAEIAAMAERLRAWTPGPKSLLDHAREVAETRAGEAPAVAISGPAARAAWREVAACVPGPWRPAPPLDDADAADVAWVAPEWPGWAGVVKRYLGGRAFASWWGVQGEGVRATACALVATLGVLRAEAARAAADARRPLDGALMREAVRRADLLLVHLAAPAPLAAVFSRTEGL